MATKIRLARRGAKKRPFYWLVVADSRSARDGSFIEKVGTYNPLASKEQGAENRITLDLVKINMWLSKGATPTERVIKLCSVSGVELPKKIAVKTQIKALAQEAVRNNKLAKAKAESDAALAAEVAAAAPVVEEVTPTTAEEATPEEPNTPAGE